MTEAYNDFRYLYPPRPDIALPADNMGIAKSWAMQTKKNGTCNVIAVSPDKNLICKTRHGGEDHKLWSPTPNSSKIFQELPGKNWFVFTAELLHSKTPKIKDTNYIFDILVNDGVYLTGTTFLERQKMLHELFMQRDIQEETHSHWCIDRNTWLAKTYYAGAVNPIYEAHGLLHCDSFVKFFKELEKANGDDDEGLVMKKPDVKMMACYKKDANSFWQIKCRRASNKYSF